MKKIILLAIAVFLCKISTAQICAGGYLTSGSYRGCGLLITKESHLADVLSGQWKGSTIDTLYGGTGTTSLVGLAGKLSNYMVNYDNGYGVSMSGFGRTFTFSVDTSFIMAADRAEDSINALKSMIYEKYPMIGNPAGYLTSFTESDPLFNTKFSGKTTSDLVEGTNEYYTNAKVALIAPGLTGSGASGNWGISITGNAATATKLSTARSINGVSFDGTSNITIGDNTKEPSLNKQNSLSIDGTGTKFPTVDAVNSGLSGKQGALSLTITGTGAATLVGNTLNIPISPSGTVTSIGITSTDFTISGSPVTSSGNITANLNTSGVSSGTYKSVTVNTKGIVTAASGMTFNNSPGRSLVTNASAANGFQISSSKDAIVNYSITIATTVSLSGNSSGYVVLEISSTNSSTAGAWTEISRVSSGQSGTLVVGLELNQIGGGVISGVIPAGYYSRIRSVNVNGTPTFTVNGSQEVYF